MRQQQIAERLNTIREGMQKQNRGVFQQRQTNGGRNNNVGGLGLSSSAWPTLQHAQQQQPPIHTSPPCFPMGPAFLGNGYGSSTGTGVFLPRPVESRNPPKKPGDYLFMMMLILSCLVENLSCTFFCVFGSNV